MRKHTIVDSNTCCIIPRAKMSSSMRENARSMGEAACNGLVRRMVSLPRNILGGFSRAVNQGIDIIGIGARRNQHNQNFHSQHPSNLPFQDPFNYPSPLIQEEWAFLSTFEQQYGPTHPFFYACRLMEALKIARDEHKFMFMYIHSPDHPFTPNFCRETLSSELVVQFLDANFVSWGGISSRGEGLHMAASLKASSFPFCAIIAPAPGDNLAVLQQMEGPVSPAELVEILQKTLEEQGVAFGSGGRANLEEKRRADRRLKEEQDAAYLAALKIDQERERERERQLKKKPSPKSISKQPNKAAETCSKTSKKGEETQILIRFPNGERREKSFLSSDKIEAIYRYIDSLGLAAAGNYRLISNFPRKVYGVDEMSMTLEDAGLNSKASLFLEML